MPMSNTKEARGLEEWWRQGVIRSWMEHEVAITFGFSCCFCEPEGVVYNILLCLDLREGPTIYIT